MQKSLANLIFLLACISCKQQPTTSLSKPQRDSISQIELMKVKNRQKVLEMYAPTTFSANYVGKENEELEITSEFFCQFDKPIIIPEKYLSIKLGEDFSTYNFTQKIVAKSNKDTAIFRFVITKEIFTSKLNNELKKYGVLLESNFEGYNSIDDSFDFVTPIGIPTGTSQSFILKIFRTGKIDIIPLQ